MTVTAEHSTHMHLIPAGRAYHGISSRISLIQFLIPPFEERRTFPYWGTYILHATTAALTLVQIVPHRFYVVPEDSYAHEAASTKACCCWAMSMNASVSLVSEACMGGAEGSTTFPIWLGSISGLPYVVLGQICTSQARGWIDVECGVRCQGEFLRQSTSLKFT